MPRHASDRAFQVRLALIQGEGTIAPTNCWQFVNLLFEILPIFGIKEGQLKSEPLSTYDEFINAWTLWLQQFL